MSNEMTEVRNVCEMPIGDEQPREDLFIERHFTGTTKDEKIKEVITLVQELGLTPHQTLIRVFDRDLISLMRQYGTDRSGIDKVDSRKRIPINDRGYVDRLRSLGLRMEDGLYALPLNFWNRTFGKDIFRLRYMRVPIARTAIAIYNGDLLCEIGSHLPASFTSQKPITGSSEFYYFKDPAHKLGALRGIISQKSPEPKSY
ncbi:MAG: hypothetical protein M1450_03365 [Patescibacteria group bacterium]|nr:hypothetical protein [Patescibacteria group bacterium]